MALLSALNSESDLKNRSKLCDLIGALFNQEMDSDEWPELITYIVEALQSPNRYIKEVGLSLLGMLPNEVMAVLFDGQNFSAIIGIYQSCLADDSDNGRLMLQALRSINCVFASLSNESFLDNFHSLTPAIFGGLELAIVGVANGKIQSPLDYPTFGSTSLDLAYVQLIVELAESSSYFFARQLSQVFDPYIHFLELPALKAEVKSLLVEFLVTLCESSPKLIRKLKSPGPAGKKGYFVEKFLPVTVAMCLAIKDMTFEAWTAVDDDDRDSDEIDDEQYSSWEVAENALYRYRLL